jgi:putative hemolysin
MSLLNLLGLVLFGYTAVLLVRLLTTRHAEARRTLLALWAGAALLAVLAQLIRWFRG